MLCDGNSEQILNCGMYNNHECLNTVTCNILKPIPEMVGIEQTTYEQCIMMFYSGKYDDMRIKEFREKFLKQIQSIKGEIDD